MGASGTSKKEAATERTAPPSRRGRRASTLLVVLAGAAAALAGSLAIAACDDSGAVKEPTGARPTGTTPGAPPGTPPVTPDGGGDAGSDCFMNPKTHFEIINACTTAQKITKNPTLPRLLPDGGLPPPS
jgi:hypothetical protein